MIRIVPWAFAALALLLGPTGAASAATTRTDATPAQLRAGKTAYDKAIATGYATATRLLDAELARRPAPKRPTVVLDIDETAMSNWTCFAAVDFALVGLATCAVESGSVAFPAARRFVRHARARKVRVVFITGAPQALCAARRRNLVAQGFPSAFTIVCNPATAAQASLVPYKSGARRRLVRAGARILVNIGDQRSDLAGGSARRTVLLPNPIYRTP